jgi:hypothetical protein
MFRNTKTDDGRLAELEATVANATQTLVDTKSATRVTWDKVKDIRAALEDSPDSPALAAGLREAEWKHREAGPQTNAPMRLSGPLSGHWLLR